MRVDDLDLRQRASQSDRLARVELRRKRMVRLDAAEVQHPDSSASSPTVQNVIGHPSDMVAVRRSQTEASKTRPRRRCDTQ